MRKLSITFIFILLLATTACAQLQDSVAIYLQKGNKGLVDKRYDYAEAEYKQVLRLDENNFEAIKNLGIVYSSTGRGDIAGEYLNRAYKINKEDEYLCNALGSFYSERKNSDKALKFFNEAIKLNDSNDIYYYNVANELMKKEKFPEALTFIRRAYQLEPNKLVNSVLLGQMYAANNHNDSAEFYFLRAITADSTNPELFYYIAMTKQAQNKLGEAIDFLHRALLVHPEHIKSLQTLGTIYLRQNKFDSAAVVLEKSVKLYPDNYSSLIQLGASYALLNNHSMADSVYLQLLQADTNYAQQMIGIIQSIKTYQLKQ